MTTVSIKFETPNSLKQSQGRRLWTSARRVHRVGPCQYLVVLDVPEVDHRAAVDQAVAYVQVHLPQYAPDAIRILSTDTEDADDE